LKNYYILSFLGVQTSNAGGVLDVKKVGRALSPGTKRNRKSTFLHPRPRRGSPAKNPLSAPKNTSLWVFSGISPKFQNARAPKNIIDTAFSFEDRSGTSMFFEHVNFQPPAPGLQSPKILFSSKRPLSNGYFIPLLDPGGGFTSETAAETPVINL
jgi:hypothetical protein